MSNNDSAHGNTGKCPKCGNHIGSEHCAQNGCNNDEEIDFVEVTKVMKRITGLLTSVMVTCHNLSDSLYAQKEITEHKTTILNACTMLRHIGGDAFGKRTELFKLMGMIRCLIPEDENKVLKDIWVITSGDSGIVLESYEDEDEAKLAAEKLDMDRFPIVHYVSESKLVVNG